jgi:hypothetical protein
MLTDRFESAMMFAAHAHAAHTRKGVGTPYLGHLLAVAGLVIDDGGTEEEAIAALLHDAVEDQGGETMRRQIEARFGAAVASIVMECTDTTEKPKPAWLDRKKRYIDHLPHASPSGLRVSMADKVHNVRCSLADLRDRKRDPFNPGCKGGREGAAWYYRHLVEKFRTAKKPPGSVLFEELERLVDELEAITGIEGTTVDTTKLPSTAYEPQLVATAGGREISDVRVSLDVVAISSSTEDNGFPRMEEPLGCRLRTHPSTPEDPDAHPVRPGLDS